MALLLSVIDEEMTRIVCTVVYDNVQVPCISTPSASAGDEIASENGGRANVIVDLVFMQ